jgi:hypothetical protein
LAEQQFQDDVCVDEQWRRTSGSPAADLVLEVDGSVLVAEFCERTCPIEIGPRPLTAPFGEEGLHEFPHLLLAIRRQSSHEFGHRLCPAHLAP